MRGALERLLGEQVCIFTVLTDDAMTGSSGYYTGTLRRLSETALELRRNDGNVCYVAFRHIVRFFAKP